MHLIDLLSPATTRTTGDMALSRRQVLLGAALGTAALITIGAPGTAAANRDPAEAGAFLVNMSERAFGMLADASVAEEVRKQHFLELLTEGFDIPKIAQFIIGRYWRSASDAERSDFIQVFEQVLVNRFLPLFSGASTDQFRVGNATLSADSANTHFVESMIRLNSGEEVAATWRVISEDKGFQILDIVVEGASMAITLRSEYGGIIKRDGGKLNGLIALLRDKVQ